MSGGPAKKLPGPEKKLPGRERSRAGAIDRFAATATTNLVPILSILLLAAGMRALQTLPVNGSPQAWAQACFYMCAYAVIFTVARPIVVGEAVKKGGGDGHT